MAALFHDAGKAETTHWEFKKGRMAVTSAGHDTAGERLALRAFDRLKIYSWNGADVRDLALRLIRTHHRAAELWQNREILTKKAFNRFAADMGGDFELAAVLDAADRAGRSNRLVSGLDREARWLLQAMKEHNVSKETIKPLVLGRDSAEAQRRGRTGDGRAPPGALPAAAGRRIRYPGGGLESRSEAGPGNPAEEGALMTKVLVAGGAGYIGSHTVKELRRAGFSPVVFDNLSSGHRDAVGDAEFVRGDLHNPDAIAAIFKEGGVSAVLHFASLIQVGESYRDPHKYYCQNLVTSLYLLEGAIKAGIQAFIFSSSAAVYGLPREVPIREEHPLDPINPYGRTKAMVEKILEDYDRAYGLRFVSLRYFNAAGADPEGDLGERHNPETHLIPNVLRAVTGKGPGLNLFGTDFDTPDGTAIRDYIHVSDLAAAHVLALRHLLAGGKSEFINLGANRGYSVREVISAAESVTGKTVPLEEKPRREGDVPVLLASNEKAERVLGWKHRFSDLETILQTAWAWHLRER